jgi:hypothetical protein
MGFPLATFNTPRLVYFWSHILPTTLFLTYTRQRIFLLALVANERLIYLVKYLLVLLQFYHRIKKNYVHISHS